MLPLNEFSILGKHEITLKNIELSIYLENTFYFFSSPILEIEIDKESVRSKILQYSPKTVDLFNDPKTVDLFNKQE